MYLIKKKLCCHLDNLFKYLGFVVCGIREQVTKTQAYLGSVGGKEYKLVEQAKGLHL